MHKHKQFDQTRTDYRIGYRVDPRYGLEAFKVLKETNNTVLYVNHLNRETRELKSSMHTWHFDFDEAKEHALDMASRKADRLYEEYTEACDQAEDLTGLTKKVALSNANIKDPKVEA
jgi:hypothetical protein